MVEIDPIAVVFTALAQIWSAFPNNTAPYLPESESPDPYWGPGVAPPNPDFGIESFKINFSDDMVNDLRYRLNRTRPMQPTLEDANSTYGTNSKFLPQVTDYWLHKYDFKKRQEYLNQYPQFVTTIQGLKIHYIHVKPELPKDSKIKVLPLLVLHGWSGSLVEFYKIIPQLTTPRPGKNFVFEVIAPSLPGFGFSDAASKTGFDAIRMATVLKNLMIRVGYNKFYIQGGDWGGVITGNLAQMYPENVLGMHSNFCTILSPKALAKLGYYSLLPDTLPENERPHVPSFSDFFYRMVERSGYFHEQATRPDTLGVGMNDSPAGLAAYLLEKFAELTNYDNRFSIDGHLSKYFTMDELIDNLMFYWAPGKITSSMRIYAESYNIRSLASKVNSEPVTVPSACARFPNEILFLPERLLKTRYINLVQQTIMPIGGHYAALEQPKLLADDVFAAVEIMQKPSSIPEKAPFYTKNMLRYF